MIRNRGYKDLCNHETPLLGPSLSYSMAVLYNEALRDPPTRRKSSNRGSKGMGDRCIQ